MTLILVKMENFSPMSEKLQVFFVTFWFKCVILFTCFYNARFKKWMDQGQFFYFFIQNLNNVMPMVYIFFYHFRPMMLFDQTSCHCILGQRPAIDRVLLSWVPNTKRPCAFFISCYCLFYSLLTNSCHLHI